MSNYMYDSCEWRLKCHTLGLTTATALPQNSSATGQDRVHILSGFATLNHVQYTLLS